MVTIDKVQQDGHFKVRFNIDGGVKGYIRFGPMSWYEESAKGLLSMYDAEHLERRFKDWRDAQEKEDEPSITPGALNEQKEPGIDGFDWDEAEKYLNDCEEAYRAMGEAGWFVMHVHIEPCKEMLIKYGIRSKELYDQIYDIKL